MQQQSSTVPIWKTKGILNPKLTIADFGCGDATLAERLLSVQSSYNQCTYKNKAYGSKDMTRKKDSDKSINKQKYCPFTVHSFDFVSNGKKLVTSCDMANLPLKDRCVNIGVFCLSLMGTNIVDFIREAHRVLRSDGILIVAEVRSRFETTSSNKKSNVVITNGKVSLLGGNNLKKCGKNDATQNKNKECPVLTQFLYVMKYLGFNCTWKYELNKMFFFLKFKKNSISPSKKINFTAKPCEYKRR